MSALALPSYLSALALLGAVGIVAVLYWLKPPPRRVIVASSLVWERVLRESHLRTDRLRWWASLLLAVLIVAATVSAIARFISAGPGGVAPKLIMVIDDSPTMATRTTDGGSRWDHAVAKASALLESRPAQSEIWLADTMRRIAVPGFQNRNDALAQLKSLRVSYGIQPTVPLPERSAGIETVVITDGVSIGTVPANARLESVFESVENAGITAFEVRALPADPRRYLAYVELVNAGGIEKRIDLTVAGISEKRVTRAVSIAAGGNRIEMFDLSDFDSGPVRASIAMSGDGLATDDVAYAMLPMRRVIRVALVTTGNPFLTESLQAQPRVKVTTITPTRFVDDRGYDAVVFDNIAPKIPPRVPALLFRPTPADWLPSSQKVIADISVSAWNPAEPMLENISLLDLRIDRAEVADIDDLPKDAVSVVASGPGGVPLILAHEDAVRWVALYFGLADSNFALQSSFPIFLNNALNWMLADRARIARGLGLIEVPLSRARVIAADGKEFPTIPIVRGSAFEVDSPGLFTIVSTGRHLRVAANLFDPRVSNVNNSALAHMEPGGAASVSVLKAIPLDTVFALLLSATVLLLLEWWSWNQRLTV